MFRSSLIVSVIVALGSIISLINQLLIARFFGASANLDTYLLAISLPVSSGALLIGVLGYQLVPILQRQLDRQGTCAPLISSLTFGFGGGSILLTLASWANAGKILALLHPHLSVPQTSLAIQMFKIAWLWLPLAVVAAVFSAALHVRKQFACAAMMQFAPTVGSACFCLVGARQFGVSSLAWGQLFGILSMTLVLGLTLGMQSFVRPDWRGFGSMFRQIPLSFCALAMFIVYPVFDVYWGSRIGPAAVSYLGYAQRLLVGLSGLVVVGATTVIFPQFALLASQGSHDELRQRLAQGLRVILVFMLPLAMVLSVYSLPILQLLFQRGSFDLDNAIRLAHLLPSMLLGMVAMSCTGLLFKALFAVGEISAAALISILGALVYFALSGALSQQFGLIGIGVSYAITWWLAMTLCIVHLWRNQLGLFLREFLRFALTLGTATALTGLVAMLFLRWLPAPETSFVSRRLFATALGGSVAATVFAVLTHGPLAIGEMKLLTTRLREMVP